MILGELSRGRYIKGIQIRYIPWNNNIIGTKEDGTNLGGKSQKVKDTFVRVLIVIALVCFVELK
jgi:hypothetical protein